MINNKFRLYFYKKMNNIQKNKLYSEKFKNLVLYILNSKEYEDGGIKKLNKMLYFIDFYFYRDHEIMISGMNYAKADMGPIVDNYKEIFSLLASEGFVKRSIECGTVLHSAMCKADLADFTGEEIEHIDGMLDRYGRLLSSDLENISHSQQPWILTDNNGEIIDPDLALLIDDGAATESEIINDQLRKEISVMADVVL